MPGQNIGPRSGRHIRVPVTEEEHASITALASSTNLPVAVLLRSLGLGYLPESLVDSRTMLELIRLKADLGRLGGVLKMWLVDKPSAGAPEADIREVLNRALELQGEVAEMIGHIRGLTERKPRR